MNAMIYMIFFCTNTGTCVENGGYVFHAPQDCIAQMASMGNSKTTLVRAKLFIGAKPYQTWYECDQKLSSEWQTVRAEPKSYTIAVCGNGVQCKQVLPAIHETIRDCALKLYDETIGARPKEYDLQGDRIYLHGNREVWMQCFNES